MESLTSWESVTVVSKIGISAEQTVPNTQQAPSQHWCLLLPGPVLLGVYQHHWMLWSELGLRERQLKRVVGQLRTLYPALESGQHAVMSFR